MLCGPLVEWKSNLEIFRTYELVQYIYVPYMMYKVGIRTLYSHLVGNIFAAAQGHVFIMLPLVSPFAVICPPLAVLL